MPLNPRILAILLGFLIATLVSACVAFVPGAHAGFIFIVFVSSGFISGLLIFYVLENLIFQEINKMLDTINGLKIKDLSISRRKLITNANPLKKLNKDLTFYMSKKEREVSELKQLARYRREFLADVSHELKTPIFAAQGFIHTLLDGAKDDEQVRDKFLQKAAKSLDGLDMLVRDLITVSQVESGEIRMHMADFDLEKTAREVMEQIEGKALLRQTSVTLKTNRLLGNNPIWVHGDALRISQVLTNLIENAIKYGKDNGKVIVSLEEGKRSWLVTVKDNGPGIPAEHLGRIFERFYRIDKSRSREGGGTGLGLAIVKHIVNAHHSQIKVSSQPNKGAIFSFKLEKPKVQQAILGA
jgi:two-component system, OmpR family, phosphate regulon sensor histidine kinase PhoR